SVGVLSMMSSSTRVGRHPPFESCRTMVKKVEPPVFLAPPYEQCLRRACAPPLLASYGRAIDLYVPLSSMQYSCQ
ncbi:MAG TPA: hypothetical protein VKX46_14940, partial [Ktedonobacteraceae bacterium]|nr:hypothetical protein [Ktedonobacteraceae bacterium]